MGNPGGGRNRFKSKHVGRKKRTAALRRELKAGSNVQKPATEPEEAPSCSSGPSEAAQTPEAVQTPGSPDPAAEREAGCPCPDCLADDAAERERRADHFAPFI